MRHTVVCGKAPETILSATDPENTITWLGKANFQLQNTKF